MKENLKLLAQLTTGKLVESASGLPVSPRTKVEIGALNSARLVRGEMLELETAKWFPHLRKQYRELKGQLEVYCSEVFLADFLADVLKKLNTGEFQIQKLPQEELENV